MKNLFVLMVAMSSMCGMLYLAGQVNEIGADQLRLQKRVAIMEAKLDEVTK